VLSQYYLTPALFCQDFNQQTINYEPGVILQVKVKKGLRAKEYKLIISKPSISFLINSCLDEENYSI